MNSSSISRAINQRELLHPSDPMCFDCRDCRGQVNIILCNGCPLQDMEVEEELECSSE